MKKINEFYVPSVEFKKDVKPRPETVKFLNEFYFILLPMVQYRIFSPSKYKHVLGANKKLRELYGQGHNVAFSAYHDRYLMLFVRMQRAGMAKMWQEGSYYKCQLLPIENMPKEQQIAISLDLF